MRTRLRSATPLLSGAVRLGKLPATSWAPFPRYSLGACLGARTLLINSIGWVLAPRLRPANVPPLPFPRLRSPVTDRPALRCQERVAYAGSALMAARCAGPPLGRALRPGACGNARVRRGGGRR